MPDRELQDELLEGVRKADPATSEASTLYRLHEEAKQASDAFFVAQEALVVALRAFGGTLTTETGWLAARLRADAMKLADYIEYDGFGIGEFEFVNVARDLHALGCNFSVWNDDAGYDPEGSIEPYNLKVGFTHHGEAGDGVWVAPRDEPRHG